MSDTPPVTQPTTEAAPAAANGPGWVVMTHPDIGGRAEATEQAFTEVWAEKGWQLAAGEAPAVSASTSQPAAGRPASPAPARPSTTTQGA